MIIGIIFVHEAFCCMPVFVGSSFKLREWTSRMCREGNIGWVALGSNCRQI